MKQKIQELLVEAMKKGDKFKVSLYRSLKADIETAEKNGNGNVIEILNKAYKKRLEARDAYLAAGREDAATAEKSEAHLISQFLPQEPSEKEIKHQIKLYYELHGKNMGVIIKGVKSVYPTIDGKKLSTMVRDFLNG